VAAGVLLELNIAKTIVEAVNMVKKARPEVDIHPQFINDLQELYPNR
jgi:hypothetical protein